MHPTGDDVLNLDLRTRYPSGGALIRDRLAGVESATRFLPDDFTTLDAFRRTRAAVDARLRGSRRTAWTEAVTARGEKARAGLEAVRDGGGYVVTTGQQPGLFGGPLYSLYKAITALVLAERLQEALGAPVVPLFWTASEDHDWAEADHCHLVGVDNELHRLGLPPVPGAGARPLHRLPMGPGVEACLRQLAELLPDTDFKEGVLDRLRTTFHPEATLPAAFEEWLADLLAPFGMLFVQAHAPALKALSRETLLRELDHAEAHEHALRERASAIEEAGYGVQVPILEGGVNLFLEGPAGRERIYRDGAGYRLRHSGKAMSRAEVVARASDDPSLLSPNVLLRPVVESAVFPTLAYVAGPGEQAYFAQLEPLFAAHGVAMPVVHPRLGTTVVETKVAKVLDKFDLDLAALDRPFHELAGDLARDQVPDEVRKAVGSLRGAVARGAQELTEVTRAIDPTLRGTVQRFRSVAFDALGDVERKIVQAVKREAEIALQQIEKAHLHLHPEAGPQERVFNAEYYLGRYGPEFVGAVVDSHRAALPPLDART